MTRKPSKTRELRAWLRGIGATHVVVEGHTERRRTVTVTTACTLARACQPDEIRIIHSRNPAMDTAVVWKHDDGVRLTIHTPTIATITDHDRDGRPIYTHQPALEGRPA
ncbi:hypothetical protein [Gordonia sp. SND2]|uniref:hypothetical protein n=1 Tax=Gordonia sp. SND2 TaxID=3388659 RepID=UPI00398B87A8